MFRRLLNSAGMIPSYINRHINTNRNTNTNDFTCEYKDAIPFVPPIKTGYVVKVYDGDTITIVSKLPYPESPLYRFQVRLNHIDCPEMKSNNEDEKIIAKLAQKELENILLHKHVRLENITTEKYGRILADVYINDLQLNKHMIEKRLAVSYNGETKMSPKSWTKYHFSGEYEHVIKH